jgi:hypothetical protein
MKPMYPNTNNENRMTKPIDIEAIMPQVIIRKNLGNCCYEMILDTSNPTTQDRSGQRFTQRIHFSKFDGNQKNQLVFLFREMANLIERGWE